MIRNILSVIVAFFIGGLCVFAVEKIGHMSYPVPNSTDFEVLKSYYLTAPAGAFLFVLLAQSAGSIVGGLVKASSQPRRKRPLWSTACSR